MKTLIVALNSKYIHSALAPWYLKSYCGDECGEIKVLEFTINDLMETVLSSIYLERADVVAFSCYIWNIAYILRLAEDLKKVSPGTKIVLGGPEVSFESEKLIQANPSIDYIIAGEGEVAFKRLLKHIQSGQAEQMDHKMPGRVTAEQGKVFCAGFDSDEGLPHVQLDYIPSPYTDEMLSSLGSRIVYFESSRGCPFFCSYCISSTFSGVSYFSMDRVKGDLSRLIKAGVRQVKFIDRTFNCNKERAKEIFKYIIRNTQNLGDKHVISKYLTAAGVGTNFHFEMVADLFDEEMFDILSEAPEGLIQFEIGVQTTNEKTLKAINRKTDMEKAFKNIKRLREMSNIHLHLDLIAGLPFEDYNSFKSSFDRVYALKPHKLQLGFLKMLKGTKVRKEAEKHGYMYREYAPYEVLYNSYLPFDKMLVLKGIEELLERYYNSGKFKKSLDFMIYRYFVSPFEFYFRFFEFNLQNGYLDRSISARELYVILLKFHEAFFGNSEVINELLKLDFLSYDNSRGVPEEIRRESYPAFKELCFDFLRDDNNLELYIPELRGMPVKRIFKQVHFELFSYDVTESIEKIDSNPEKTVVLFNYQKRSKVTGLYEYHKIKLF